LTTDGKAIDPLATEDRRRELREARKQESAPISGKSSAISAAGDNGWRRLLRFHATLELVTDGKQKAIRCSRCGHLYCTAEDNYKLYALHRVVHLDAIMPPLPTGEPYIGEYHMYSCPGCASQLQVDLFSPSLGGDPVLWDTKIQ
jgi:acetone carboxylase gamma subunit